MPPPAFAVIAFDRSMTSEAHCPMSLVQVGVSLPHRYTWFRANHRLRHLEAEHAGSSCAEMTPILNRLFETILSRQQQPVTWKMVGQAPQLSSPTKILASFMEDWYMPTSKSQTTNIILFFESALDPADTSAAVDLSHSFDAITLLEPALPSPPKYIARTVAKIFNEKTRPALAVRSPNIDTAKGLVASPAALRLAAPQHGPWTARVSYHLPTTVTTCVYRNISTYAGLSAKCAGEPIYACWAVGKKTLATPVQFRCSYRDEDNRAVQESFGSQEDMQGVLESIREGNGGKLPRFVELTVLVG